MVPKVGAALEFAEVWLEGEDEWPDGAGIGGAHAKEGE